MGLQNVLQPFIFINMKNIDLILDGVPLGDMRDIVTVPSQRTAYEINVIVDYDETLPNYEVESSGDNFITYDKVGNNVFVVVNENTGIKERHGYLKFTHAMDSDVKYILGFAQNKMDYPINLEYDNNTGDIELVFSKLIDSSDDDCETFVINVNCEYGVKDFNISKIEEYTNAEMTKKIIFDNGFEVEKMGNSGICIKNYGKITTLPDVRYKITVSHQNDISSYKTITIRYNNSDTDNGFGFDDD